MEAADVTGDGRVDIIGAGWGGLSVLRNLGNARFAAPEQLTSHPQKDLQVGDVTGDGRADIVSCPAARGVMVFTQLAGGGLGGPNEQPGIDGCSNLALADVNGDGRTDISFVGRGNAPERLYLLLQRPDGAFGAPESYPTFGSASVVRAGDMNADGRRDLVLLHTPSSHRRIGVHAQAPDHTLDPERLYELPDARGPLPPALTIGDVNGDGRPDIAVADNEQGLLVLLGRQAGPSTTTSTSMLPSPTPYGLPTASKPDIFGSAQTYGLGAGAESVATGDFNGDGRTDVAAVTRAVTDPAASMKLFVLYQGSDGSLQRAVKYDTDAAIGNASGNPFTLALAAGDLDGDGRDDLVLRMWDGIDIFLQRDGRFADRIYREILPGFRADIADLDGDGKGDLVISGAGIRLYRSLGAGAFAPPVTVDEREVSQAIALGDVSGDGRPDIVAYADHIDGSEIKGTVAVYRQRADHGFDPAVRTDAGGRYGSVALGDFNGDGRRDVAVSHSVDGGGTPEKIRILAQSPGGTLTPVDDLDHAHRAGSLRAGDLNGDGLTDLVALADGGKAHTWTQKDGHLEIYMSSFLAYATWFTPTALALADFSGDGWLDVATANPNTGVEVLRNVTTEGAFHPLAPARILDTRAGVGAPAARLGPGGTINLQVSGAGGVPRGATSVVMNVTVTEPTAGSYLTAWPASERRPLASNLNYVAGQTVPNLVTVRIGLEGKVSLYNLAGSTHIIADVAGWYGVDYGDAGSRYTPVTPARVLDTRTGVGALAGKLGPSGTLGLQVTGRGGVPASGVSAVVLNVTVTEPTAGSYMTAWPAGQARPLASNLNYLAGQTVPNLVVVKVGAGGVVNLYNLAGATHVIADVAGWFGAGPRAPTGSFSSGGPVRVLDTRQGLGGMVGPGGTLTIRVTGTEPIPPSGLIAAVLNVTVTQPTAGSF